MRGVRPHPRTRTGRIRDRSKDERSRGGGSATPGGSARRIGSRCARAAGSGGCARISSGARRLDSVPRPPPPRASRRSSLAFPGAPTSRFAALPPAYADQIRFSIVHHTAGQNDYSRARQPRSSRRSSSTTSGRTAGTTSATTSSSTASARSTRAASEARSETSSALTRKGSTPARSESPCSGRTGARRRPAAAQEAIATLVSWRLDLAHVDPTAALTFVSGGSNRFPGGRAGASAWRVRTPGHRVHGVSRQPALRATQQPCDRGGSDRLAEDLRATRRVGRRIRPLPGEALVEPALGGRRHGCREGRGRARRAAQARRSTGRGTRPSSPRGPLHVDDPERIRASGDRSAARRRRDACRLAIQALAASPEAITPNGDGQGDAAVVSFRLTASANVTVEVVDDIRSDRRNGRRPSLDAAPASTRSPSTATTLLDGTYDVVVRARTPAGLEVEKTIPLRVSRTLGLGLGDSGPLLAQRGRSERQPADRLLADGRGRRQHPHPARRPLGREPAHGELRGGCPQPSSGTGHERQGVCGTARTRRSSRSSDVAVGPLSVAVPFTSDTTAPRVRLLPDPRSPRGRQRAGHALSHDRRRPQGARGEEGRNRPRSRGAAQPGESGSSPGMPPETRARRPFA